MASYMGHEYTPAPTQVVQGRYRVGDRVRVVKDGLAKGGSHHRAAIGEVTCIKKVVDEEFIIGDNEWSFKPHEIQPAFRPGDRVKLNKHSGVRACGERGTVSAVIGDNVSVRMDELSHWGGRVAVFPVDVLDWERVEEPAADCAGRKEQQGNVETLTIKLDLDTSGFSEKLDAALGANRPCIVALTKNGQPRPSTYPHVHASVQAATIEAERLAKINPGQEFAVYQRVAGRVAEVQMKEVA